MAVLLPLSHSVNDWADKTHLEDWVCNINLSFK